MEFEVQLFASLRESLGTSAVTVAVKTQNDSAQVLDLLEALRATVLKDMDFDFRVAVNCSYVDDDFILAGGEEIALIPPVSGG